MNKQHLPTPEPTFLIPNPRWTELQKAVYIGNCKEVARLVKDRTTIEARTPEGFTALLIAVEKQDTHLMLILLENGANVNILDPTGHSPLHAFAVAGSVHVVVLLLKYGADIEIRDIYGKTPLNLAATFGKIETVGILLENQAEVNTVDSGGHTPLLGAIKMGHASVVSKLIEWGANFTHKGGNSLIPLHYAADHFEPEIVDIFLNLGEKVDIESPTGLTALHISSMYGDVRTLRVLLNHGANVESCAMDGYFPLLYSTKNGHTSNVIALLENHANANMHGKNDISCLHIAAAHGNVSTAEALLQYGAQVEHRDSTLGASSLHLAAGVGHYKVVQLLLDYGAKIDIAMNDGQTSLHLAAAKGHLNIVEFLLKGQAALNMKDKLGETPIFKAASYGHVPVVKILLRYGAIIDQCSAKIICASKAALIKHHKEASEITKKLCDTCSKQSKKHQQIAEYMRHSAVSSPDISALTETVIFGRAKIHESSVYNTIDLNGLQFTENEHIALQKKALLLDDKIRILPNGDYSDILGAVDSYIAELCAEVERKCPAITLHTILKCGSLPAGLKVGLPLEADYVFLLKTSETVEFDCLFELTNQCISRKHYIKQGNVVFKVQNVKQTAVSYCLTLEAIRLETKNKAFGISVDLVPATGVENHIKGQIEPSYQLENFIQHYLRYESTSTMRYNSIELLSTKRERLFDIGPYMHKIYKSLSPHLKRELRIAKFLCRKALEKRAAGHIEDIPFKEQIKLIELPMKPSSSFHVALCFFATLLGMHSNHQEIPTTSGVLALSVLMTLAQTYSFFSKCLKIDAKAIIWFDSPFLGDRCNIQHTNHLHYDSETFGELSTKLQYIVCDFIDDDESVEDVTLNLDAIWLIDSPSSNFNINPPKHEILDLTGCTVPKSFSRENEQRTVDDLLNDVEDEHVESMEFMQEQDEDQNTDNDRSGGLTARPNSRKYFGDVLKKIGTDTILPYPLSILEDKSAGYTMGERMSAMFRNMTEINNVPNSKPALNFESTQDNEDTLDGSPREALKYLFDSMRDLNLKTKRYSEFKRKEAQRHDDKNAESPSSESNATPQSVDLPDYQGTYAKIFRRILPHMKIPTDESSASDPDTINSRLREHQEIECLIKEYLFEGPTGGPTDDGETSQNDANLKDFDAIDLD